MSTIAIPETEKAWGEWENHLSQVITTGSRLSCPDLRVEDHSPIYLRPLWDKDNDLIDLQKVESNCRVNFEFTATAALADTLLEVQVRNSVTSAILRNGITQLPDTGAQSYSLSIPFTTTNAEQASIDDKIEIFLISDGTVTISDAFINLSSILKRS
jgi:hypothetical protein